MRSRGVPGPEEMELVHVNAGKYRVLVTGQIECATGEGGRVRVTGVQGEIWDASKYLGCENRAVSLGLVGVRVTRFKVDSREAGVDAMLIRGLYSSNSTVPLRDLRKHHQEVSVLMQHELDVAKAEVSDLAVVQRAASQDGRMKDTVIGVISLVTASFTAFLVFMLVRQMLERRRRNAPPSSTV